MAAVRPSVDLELDDLFVGVHEVFVLVLILKTILERVLPDISSVLNLLVDLIEQVADFFYVRPEVGLYFGKDKQAVDFDLEGTVSGEDYNLLFLLVEVSLKSETSGREVGVFDVMFWRVILGDGDVLEDGPYFSLDAVVELVVFGFVMP